MTQYSYYWCFCDDAWRFFINLNSMQSYTSVCLNLVPMAMYLFLHVVPVPNRPTTPLTAGALVPPPRPSSRPKLPAGKLTGINEIVSPYHISICAAIRGSLLTLWYPPIWLPSLRYGRSAHPKCLPALRLLHRSPGQRAHRPYPPMPRLALAIPPLSVSVLRLLDYRDRFSFSSPPHQCPTCPCLCTTVWPFPCFPSSSTPLPTGAEHPFALLPTCPEPELLSLSPFFLLSQSESLFPNTCFPKMHFPTLIISTLNTFLWRRECRR